MSLVGGLSPMGAVSRGLSLSVSPRAVPPPTQHGPGHSERALLDLNPDDGMTLRRHLLLIDLMINTGLFLCPLDTVETFQPFPSLLLRQVLE